MPTTTDIAVVPAEYQDLLRQPLIAHLATLRPDGNLQSNPVWFAWDGERIKISQTKSRQKYRNLSRYPKAAFSIVDRTNPYRHVEIRGDVVEVDDDTTNEFIDHLAQRYLGQEHYPWHQRGDERV